MLCLFFGALFLLFTVAITKKKKKKEISEYETTEKLVMAPASFDWWKKDSRRGTPVVVKMENPNWSMVELEGPSEEDFLISDSQNRSGDNNSSHNNKSRNRNAKQLTWVLLLKAHRAAGCLTSIASTFFSLGSAIRRRVASGRTDADNEPDPDAPGINEDRTIKTRFYAFIKVFFWLSVVLLVFEVAAYFKGWHFGAPKLQLEYVFSSRFSFKGTFDLLYSSWVLIRVEYLAPPLQFLADTCIFLFLIQSLDRVILCLGCFYIRLKRIKPVAKQDDTTDLETGEQGFFPMVLVQIPMCNEKEVTICHFAKSTTF